jgi:GrpB-like predicted nucleotidyltransferase (UPF0157 family)
MSLISNSPKTLPDSALAREYHLLKLALAKRYPEDRGSYTRGKGAFIEKVLHHEEG